jgi:hypothetical protein
VSPAAWLEHLERSLADDEGTEALANGLVVLATVAGRDVHLDEAEARGVTLLLSAGGDPERGLDLHGRAVGAVADDLRTVDRQLALEDGLKQLRLQAEGLPHVSEALHGLTDAPDVAWRAFAAGVLAQALGEEEG